MEEAATPQNNETWALVEVFGHRRHYGRVTEVEKFGTKMLRVDVPTEAPDRFETFHYGGAAIFGMTEMTEEVCRKLAERDRPRPVRPIDRLPPPRRDFWEDSEADEGADAPTAENTAMNEDPGM